MGAQAVAMRIGISEDARLQHLGFLSDFREKLGFSIPGDIVGNGKSSKGTPAFGMDHAFGNSLTILRIIIFNMRCQMSRNFLGLFLILFGLIIFSIR
jgi:hypothetical protein